MKTAPQGYWSSIFDAATKLLRSRPDLNGDHAYWIAKKLVDEALAEPLPLLEQAS